jgi:hypothetical protein
MLRPPKITSPALFTTDGNTLVWSESTLAEIHSAPVAGGSAPIVIATLPTSASALVMAGGRVAYMYPTTSGTFHGFEIGAALSKQAGSGADKCGHPSYPGGSLAIDPSGNFGYYENQDALVAANVIKCDFAGSAGASSYQTLSAKMMGGSAVVDASYFFYSASGTIYRSGSTFVGAQTSPSDLITDGTYLYWLNNNSEIWAVLESNPASPQRLASSLGPNASLNGGLATDGKYIYFSNGAGATGGINYMSISGGAIKALPSFPSASEPWDVVAVGGYIYWNDIENNTINAMRFP